MPEKEKPVDKKDESQEQEEGQQPAKKGIPKIFIFIGGGVVLLLIIVFVVVKMVLAPAAKEEAAEEAAAAVEVEAEPEYTKELFSFEQAIIVNIAETNGQRYLKANIQLELDKPETAEELDARKPQVLDLVISIMSAKTLEEVSNVVGRNRLKREIVDRINAELVTGKVINIYFTEFVIQ